MRNVVVLPQPEGPEHRKEAAVVDREVRALHGRELIERFAQILDFDPCHCAIPEND